MFLTRHIQTDVKMRDSVLFPSERVSAWLPSSLNTFASASLGVNKTLSVVMGSAILKDAGVVLMNGI